MFHKKALVRRLNTKRSTEADLVGVSEYLPYNLWIMIVLHGKRYENMNYIVYQDSQIATMRDKNERKYFTGNSRHINIRYCFVKYSVDKGEVKIKYRPIQMILAYFFTNPLKGKVLKIFRDVIMGYKPIFSLESIPVSIKECVRNNR